MKFNIDVRHQPPANWPPCTKKLPGVSDEDWVEHAYSTLPGLFTMRGPEDLVVLSEPLSSGVRITVEGNLNQEQFNALTRRVIHEQNQLMGMHLVKA